MKKILPLINAATLIAATGLFVSQQSMAGSPHSAAAQFSKVPGSGHSWKNPQIPHTPPPSQTTNPPQSPPASPASQAMQPSQTPQPTHGGSKKGKKNNALPAALGGFLGGIIVGTALSNSTNQTAAGTAPSSTQTAPRQRTVSVQNALKRLGYYRGSVDGIVGPQTRRAISTYQSDYDLPVTSRVDKALLVSLGLESGQGHRPAAVRQESGGLGPVLDW